MAGKKPPTPNTAPAGGNMGKRLKALNHAADQLGLTLDEVKEQAREHGLRIFRMKQAKCGEGMVSGDFIKLRDRIIAQES